MERKELFDKTINTLVKAYQRGDLDAFNCAGCAVGNIVAGSLNYGISGNNFVDAGKLVRASWRLTLYAKYDKDYNIWAKTNYKLGLYQINSTGYSKEELILIEKAFIAASERAGYNRITMYREDGTIIGRDEELEDAVQYAGLMAVVDTLISIHKGNSKAVEQAKLQFVKQK